ncbi:uncharacterized protein [Asterias amurensis]|uniref:uncharacterized protein isoform X2 n=1 Tax=Asterias amurensis TaxID=7602 RepID=UPI003AB4D35D
MAEIPKIPESPVGTTGTKEVQQSKDKGKWTTDSHHKMDFVQPGKSTHKLDLSSKMTTYEDDEYDYEVELLREVQEGEKHLRHILNEIDELSTMVTTEMLPGQLHSLMEKLIKEQKQLVNFQQEMAISVHQRATDSQLDQHPSRDLSELDVLLSKIHLVSLKLNLHRMKSVDEAQMKTDTKVSEKQHHDKMKQAPSKLEWTLMHLVLDLINPDCTPPHVGNNEKKQHMIESVYYCQQMLVDDLQQLVPHTLLVKEPAYQEQYMKNLNVVINTQQQLVQNLTDLQKQKKGSKLEKASSKQDDLPAGEIGKQLNELELINEQTDLVKDWHRWIECHRGWQEQQPGRSILIVIYSVLTVHRIHGWTSRGFTWMVFMETIRCYHRAMNGFAYEKSIIHHQEYFLDKAEMWNKRQKEQTIHEANWFTCCLHSEKEMQDDSNVVRYSLQDDPTDLKQSKQDDQTDESDLEGLKTSTKKTSLSDKDEALKKRQEDKTEHMRHISKEIYELSNLVTTETPPQLHSLVEKLIKEQEQLVNFQQEMATSVNQRATDSQLDQQTSRDLSELDVLLSKIHLVSLKLNLHRMKSVDEAQVITDTKVSEEQDQDKMKKAQFTLQETLNNLGIELRRSYGSSRVQKYDTKLYMTESVSYCQQMLVDDFQKLVSQTLLVKKPAYQEQYMKNLNVLINTQQQLVQNLTDLQKQKKGSKLEKAFFKQEDLPAGEVGKQQNEFELITEQTDLVKDCLHWVQCHRDWQEQHIGHSIFMVICSVYSVHRIHGRLSHGIDFWKYVMESVTDFIDMTIYGENEKFVNNEKEIMLSQIMFLHKAEGTRTKRQEQASVESGGSPEATIVSDVTDKPIDEDSNLDAAGFTSITQTTQADTQMALKNETPSHLKDVLNKFNNHTKDISAKEKTGILLQLPYMAVGFFNNRGGILALEKYDVHLIIPHGAIPEGPPQLVYIYVNPDEVVADTVNSEEEQLSPAVQCGPPGLTFKKSVVLSFPHHAESSDWEFTAKMSSASSESWQALDSSTDGQLVSAQGDKAIFLVKHFSLFTLFGRSLGKSRKRVRVGAFGDIFDPKSYAFRVYVWKDDRVSEQRVLEFEKERTSEILDAFRDLQFRKNQGHMSVEMTRIDEGWEVRPQNNQEIHKEDVWVFSQNSVSFNVSSRSRNADDIPYMAVNCYQQQERDDGQGRNILLSVGPRPNQMGNNNLIQIRDARRPPEARNRMPDELHTSGSGNNTLHLPNIEVDGAIQSAVAGNRQRPELFGELISAQNDEPEPILPFPNRLPLTDIETQVLFLEVAEQLGADWVRLATYLGLRRGDLYAIRHDNAGDVRDQIFCMLVRWKQGFGAFGEAAFNTLSSSLRRIGRNDIVEFVERNVTR